MEQVEQFLGIETGAFDAQLVDGFGQIRDAAEIEADGRAAPGRLRLARGPYVFDGLAGLGQIVEQARAIGMRCDRPAVPSLPRTLET